MTSLNTNKTIVRFYVHNLSKATSWYKSQVDKAPVLTNKKQTVFAINDSLLILIKQPNGYNAVTTPAAKT